MNQPQKCKILLLGQSAVGKTSLFRKFTGNQDPRTTPTIGAEYKQKMLQLKNGTTMKVQLWDTAGTERYRTISPIYYRHLDGVLLIFDITDMDSFNGLQYWLDELTEKGEEAIIVLVGNKNDQKQQRQVTREAAEQKAKQLNITYIEANSLSEAAVKEPFEVLLEQIAYKRSKQATKSHGLDQKKSQFQELRLKDLPNRKSKVQGQSDCC